MDGVCGPWMHRAVDRGESKPLFGSNCSRLGSLSPSLSPGGEEAEPGPALHGPLCL